MTAASMRFFSPVWNQLFKKAWRSTRSSSSPSMFRWYSSTTSSRVRVPVLSVQRMSIPPRSWMALRFFTMTLRRLMAMAPLASEVVTIMGSISGVRPTATEMANSSACIQSPLVNPLTNSTTGTITSMKRMSTQETALTPFSKVVLGGFSSTCRASAPSMVSPPTASTTAVAEPLMTLLPRKARFGASVRAPPAAAGPPLFSTGSLSPVRADWLTDRSFAARMRTSAGIMSPAQRCTTSPATMSSSGTSSRRQARSTQAVVCSMLPSRAATLPLRVSCTKRSAPEMSTIAVMMSTVA